MASKKALKKAPRKASAQRGLPQSYRYHPGTMRLTPMPESLRERAEGMVRVYSEKDGK